MSRILLIDDDIDMLEITKALLSRKGFEIEIAPLWEDACRKIETFEPNVILLDVFLSGIDGLEICKLLKSQQKTRDIPIVIVSAYPRVAETVIYEYGADDFLAKPFELNDLVLKIHSLLSPKAGIA